MSRCEDITQPSDLLWPVRQDLADLEPDTVRVWCGLLQCESERLVEWQQTLSREELERAGRFRTPRMRHRFIMSRVVLRRILGSLMGLAPDRVRMEADAAGKPRLVDGGGIEFNLAHTADLLLVAVTRGLSVGVDVERCRPLKDCQAIARRFFTKREADWLEGFRDAALDRAFFRLWTRKEAILKSTGEGLSGGLDSLELLEAGGSFRSVVIRSAGGAAEQGWGLTELVPAAGFAGALALPADAGRVELQAATYQLA